MRILNERKWYIHIQRYIHTQTHKVYPDFSHCIHTLLIVPICTVLLRRGRSWLFKTSCHLLPFTNNLSPLSVLLSIHTNSLIRLLVVFRCPFTLSIFCVYYILRALFPCYVSQMCLSGCKYVSFLSPFYLKLFRSLHVLFMVFLESAGGITPLLLHMWEICLAFTAI